MDFRFEILDTTDILRIVPLVEKLNDFKVPKAVLEARFLEMATQNYECAVIFDTTKIIGVCGLWFCTRHYVGKTVEVDHVYIEELYRGKGVGKQFFKWIYDYVKRKNCNTVELNTYVNNFASHKFVSLPS